MVNAVITVNIGPILAILARLALLLTIAAGLAWAILYMLGML